MLSFNKIVHKLLQKPSKIILLKQLAELVNPGDREVNATVRKIAGQLVDSSILLRLRNGLYFIADKMDNQKEFVFPPVDSILLNHYWEIVHAMLSESVGSVSKIIIAGPKSLEIHSLDFSPPPVLHVYVDIEKVCLLKISPELSLRMKPIQSGMLSSKNLFPALKALGVLQKFPGTHPVTLRILPIEAALLDALLKHDSSFSTYSVERYIQRKPVLRRELLGKLVLLRYISSINRLRELAQKNNLPTLANLCKEIIRDEGKGCYLSSGLKRK